MNSGDVRVLFGSTTMLGTGVNAQRRAVAVHELECPCCCAVGGIL